MCNVFSKWTIGTKIANLHEQIDRAILTIEKYEGFHAFTDTYDGNVGFAVKKENAEKKCFNIFLENIQIHVLASEKEKIYSLRLRDTDNPWTFNKKDNGEYDYSHPVNSTYEVYVKYDIPVLDITRAMGIVYKHGSWDGCVLAELNEFFNCKDAVTPASIFNRMYRKWKKK